MHFKFLATIQVTFLVYFFKDISESEQEGIYFFYILVIQNDFILSHFLQHRIFFNLGHVFCSPDATVNSEFRFVRKQLTPNKHKAHWSNRKVVK